MPRFTSTETVGIGQPTLNFGTPPCDDGVGRLAGWCQRDAIEMGYSTRVQDSPFLKGVANLCEDSHEERSGVLVMRQQPDAVFCTGAKGARTTGSASTFWWSSAKLLKTKRREAEGKELRDERKEERGERSQGRAEKGELWLVLPPAEVAHSVPQRRSDTTGMKMLFRGGGLPFVSLYSPHRVCCCCLRRAMCSVV